MGSSFWPLYITTIFNAQKRFLKNSPHDVQIKGGGGVKGLLNNVKKNCTFLTRWLPLESTASMDNEGHWFPRAVQGKSVFIKLFWNGWSNLNDSFGRPHEISFRLKCWKNQPSSTSARNFWITRIADFGLFWPKCASVFVGDFFPLGN